jgi:hypothetical protein
LCPDGGGEVETTAPSWNKSFRPRLCLGGTSSGAGERSVKVSSDLVPWWRFRFSVNLVQEFATVCRLGRFVWRSRRLLFA